MPFACCRDEGIRILRGVNEPQRPLASTIEDDQGGRVRPEARDDAPTDSMFGTKAADMFLFGCISVDGIGERLSRNTPTPFALRRNIESAASGEEAESNAIGKRRQAPAIGRTTRRVEGRSLHHHLPETSQASGKPRLGRPSPAVTPVGTRMYPPEALDSVFSPELAMSFVPAGRWRDP
ncbi:hypothetical protein PLEOSDRAFT_1108514 [Pleurotus ostreatus PC15]|uniref:Uncharacterized protein n=1 Tax=Pleurotus ostreatus (strain PC15) TaxID=1137138 RepID=A0A067NIX6_PLEO1|nr:hypothetical protein PLEOSDRAFT_1108514 [Pleurotus ostreatus PC15]